MKKRRALAIAVIAIASLFLVQCQKKSTETPTKPLSEINNDQLWLTHYKVQIDRLNKITDINKLRLYSKDGRIDEQEQMNIHRVLGFNNADEMNTYFIQLGERLRYFEENYQISKQSKADQIVTFNKTYDQVYSSKCSNFLFMMVGPCEDGQDVCKKARTSEAMVAHFGCAGLSMIALPVGVACHLAVLGMQVNTMAECDVDYKKCLTEVTTPK